MGYLCFWGGAAAAGLLALGLYLINTKVKKKYRHGKIDTTHTQEIE